MLCSLSITLAAFIWTAEVSTQIELPKESQETFFYANQAQDDLTQTYVQAINSAEKSIVLLIYSLTDNTVINALKNSIARGVSVTIVCDGEATPNAKQRLGKKAIVYPRYDQGLMHLKILTVDKKILFVGSSNLTSHSLKIHGNLVMGFFCSEAAMFVESRANEIASGEGKIQLLHQNFLVGDQRLEFWFLPGNNQAINRILNLIDGAKKSIRVAMYTFTRYDLAEALIRAQKRGVDVEVLIDRGSAKGASKKVAHLLHRNNIALNTNSDIGLAHHKFMYIDQKSLVNGSANWTKAAFTQNHDCFIVIDKLNKIQQQKMNKLWKIIVADSKKYTLK